MVNSNVTLTYYCNFCGNEFKPQRKTARFCSDQCRVYLNRVSVTEEQDKPKVSVTKEVSVASPVAPPPEKCPVHNKRRGIAPYGAFLPVYTCGCTI